MRRISITFIAVCLGLIACTKAQQPVVETPMVQQGLYVYLVDIDGDGTGETFGCGDTLVPVNRTVTTVGDSIPVTVVAALNDLFGLTSQDVADQGLYTVFDKSDLTAVRAEVQNWTMTVEIEGTVSFGGACDVPRFYDQIDATIRQFPGLREVKVLLNGSEDEYRAVGSSK